MKKKVVRSEYEGKHFNNELLQILNKCEGIIGKLVFQLAGVA